jgi:hypothetical protein
VDDFQEQQGKLRGRSVAIIGFSLIALGLLLFFVFRSKTLGPASETTSQASSTANAAANQNQLDHQRRARRGTTAATVEEIVASKVAQFGRDRLGIARAMARHYKIEVPPEVEAFFAAVESGDWARVDAMFKSLRERIRGDEDLEHLRKLWPAILETYGVMEQVQDWPAQKLLDYGNAALGSLREEMVYIGGSDPGRFIPTLLNETSDGQRHIVLTQNAFADQSYLEYVNFLYGDRLGTLSTDESQRAFRDYISDAQKRFQHDRDFPDEPKQVRPGEDLQMIENRFQVSGTVAVMDINERLLRMLMEKNPDISFAMQESSSLPSTYAGAAPLGPLIELRARDASVPFTPEQAGQSVAYWRDVRTQFGASDPEDQTQSRNAWGHMAVAQGNFLSSQNFGAEAEQIYVLASQLAPAYFEAVGRLARHFDETGRRPEAFALVEDFLSRNPDRRDTVDTFRNTWLMPRASATAVPPSGQGLIEAQAGPNP